MKKDLSKQSFFNSLTLNLLFYFNNEECSSILNDYEDWFENEALHGKSEKEICTALEEPRTIVKKLLIESGSSSSRFFILSHNPMIQVILLIAGHLLAMLLLLNILTDDYHPLSCTYRVVIIIITNILYFIAGMKLIKKSDDSMKPHNFIKRHLFLFFFIILFIPLVYFLAYLPKSPSFYGPACVNTFHIIALIGYIVNIYFSIHKVLQNKQFTQFTFCTLFHISGIISVMVFLISQSLGGDTYGGMPEFFITGAYGTFLIYAEIFVLCLLSLKKSTYKE